MKITRMKWSNYKGLQDGEIHADGCDVYVSGRNGVGKSSLASIIPFVLFGKTDGDLRRYEDGFAMNNGLVHSAEIEFDNGLILRREKYDSLRDNGLKGKCYINGELYKDKDYDAEISKLLNKAGEIIFNPFAFCKLNWAKQRELLLKHFGTIDEKSLLQMPEYAELSKELNGLTVAGFMKQRREVLKKLKSDVKDIPARITELKLRLEDKPADIESIIARLNGDVEECQAKIAACQKMINRDVRAEHTRVQNGIDSLARRIDVAEDEISSEERRRKVLLEQYNEVIAQKPGKCKLCGQDLPQDKVVEFMAQRKARIAAIVEKGTACADRIKEMTKRLATMKVDYSKLEDDLKRLQPQLEQASKSDEEQFAEMNRLNAEVTNIKVEISRLKDYQGIENRIAQLSKREKELNADITRSEGLIAAAEDFQRRAVETVEGQINSQFEHVTFRMFNLLVSGELAGEACEAMLHGVPYSALSKGERLKAALDIWRTWQRVFGVEMPLILDDAESYTPNSFVDVPNQKFYFLVTDGELKISVLRERQAK